MVKHTHLFILEEKKLTAHLPNYKQNRYKVEKTDLVFMEAVFK